MLTSAKSTPVTLARVWQRLVSQLISASQRGFMVAGIEDTLDELRTFQLNPGPLAWWVPSGGELVQLRHAHGCVARLIAARDRVDIAERDRQLSQVFVQSGECWLVLRSLAEAAIGAAPDSHFERANAAPFQPRRPTTGYNLWQSCRKLENGRPPLPSLPEFGTRANQLSIYLDEAWPDGEPGQGVLAGVVWIGHGLRVDELPQIPTHLLQSDGRNSRDPAQRAEMDADRNLAVRALENLLHCHSAIPFVMPIVVAGRRPKAEYDRLITACLQVLLGWMLPRSGPKVAVRVYLEQYGGHQPGDDQTGYFRGVLEGVSQGYPERFGRWQLDRVEWQQPDFEYIPYADLIAYLAQQHTHRSRALAEAVDFRNWPGYVPLSLDLVPRLLRLDAIEAGVPPTDTIDLATELDGTEIGRLVVAELRGRLTARPELQLQVLETLDARFRNPDRDLDQLSRQLAVVRLLLQNSDKAVRPRLHLLLTALEFQEANHDGDPVRVCELAREYARIRQVIADYDRELAAYTDLNLAVHQNDQFEFGQAEILLDELKREPMFSAFRPLTRGWILSSWGQAQALLSRYPEADAAFANALACYERADVSADERARHRRQTGCYRAFAALDAGHPAVVQIVEDVIGPLNEAISQLQEDSGPEASYYHHLLVRCLWFRPELDETRRTYLSVKNDWICGTRHPWPLIDCYRALLLDSGGGDLAEVEMLFVRALKGIVMERTGATIHLIGGMIATVARCVIEDQSVAECARELIGKAEAQLPGAAGPAEVLRGVLQKPSRQSIFAALTALPFYYH